MHPAHQGETLFDIRRTKLSGSSSIRFVSRDVYPCLDTHIVNKTFVSNFNTLSAESCRHRRVLVDLGKSIMSIEIEPKASTSLGTDAESMRIR